jgi:sentrin-specific protease 7
MDDLSAGHYKKSTPAIPEKRKGLMEPSAERKNDSGLAQVIEDTLGVRKKRRRLQKQSDEPEVIGDAQAIHDTSDEEIHLLEKSNIKPTLFAASEGVRSKVFPSKKAAPKDKRVKETFRLVQLFSSSHTWFLGDEKKEWAIVHDASNSVLSIEGKDAIPMSMTTGCISLIEYSEDSAKITIHKSKDNTFGSTAQIHVTLAGIDDSVRLSSSISAKNPTMKLTRKTKLVFCPFLTTILNDILIFKRDYMDKVFTHSRKLASIGEKKKQQNVKEDPATISHATQKPGLAAKRKEPPPRGNRIIDQLDSNETLGLPETARKSKVIKKPASLPTKNVPPIQTFFDLTGDEVNTKSPTPGPATPGSDTSLSVSRLKKETPFSRRNSLDSQWTQVHPEWRDNWKSSIVYPPTGKDRATINAEDIERLDEDQYLNDSLILFYMRWLWAHAQEAAPEASKRIHIMNTFFYERLTTTPKGTRGFNYKAVERWTSKIDLPAYDYIVVPVCEHTHWYLAIICNVKRFLGESPEAKIASQSPEGAQKGAAKTGPEQTAVPSDAQNLSQGAISTSSPTVSPNKKGKKKVQAPPARKMDLDAPRIITLDSLGNKHSPTCINLKEYLMAEIKAKRGIDIQPPPGAIGMTASNIPRQNNGSDCGVFLLNYLEKFLAGPDEFIRNVLQGTPKFMHHNFPSASETRTKIRNLLFELQAENISAQLPHMSDEPQKADDDTGADSDRNKPRRSSPFVSQSPGQTTSMSNSPEQAIQEPATEQLVSTPTESSTEGGSRLGSLGAGEGSSIISDEPVAPIHNSVRKRQHPSSQNVPGEDDDEASEVIEVKNNIAKSKAAKIEVAGTDTENDEDDNSKEKSSETGDAEDNEMLLGRASPQLLSDPGFSSPSSLSSTPAGGHIPKSSKTSKSRDESSYALDGADHAFISKGTKRLKKH